MDEGRCCCGKIKEGIEPIERLRINDTVHARLGDEGAFCGPWWQHEIDDLRKIEAAARKFREATDQAYRDGEMSHVINNQNQQALWRALDAI